MRTAALFLSVSALACTPSAAPNSPSIAVAHTLSASVQAPEAEAPALEVPHHPLLSTLGDIVNGIGGDLSAWGTAAFEPKPSGVACNELRARLGKAPLVPPADPDEPPPKTQPFEEVCYEDGSGAAWGTRVTFAVRELNQYGGEFELLRFSAKGSRSNAPLFSAGVERYEGLGFSDEVHNSPPEWLWFYDFDHDGRPEALARHWESVDNAHRDPKIETWTARSPGKLERYAPAEPYFAFAIFDLDRDGRPDLAFNPYAKSVTEPTVYVGNYPRHSLVDWSLLAHALPDGSFSTQDDVARDYAKLLCPAAVNQLPQERDQWPYAIHCAKLWGSADADTLRHWLERGCAKADPEWLTPCESSKEFYRALVDVELPLTLQETAHTSR